ncbi:hypothetical protein [Mycetocola tolaasinivorans]|uniref:hypothetical protein n=1 Tax=Mycetocola tolaasinivorans TaxID=76635 RepID=UPI0011C496F8|nr:hypothetical protein [Mycetocola tolaasinivorans]
MSTTKAPTRRRRFWKACTVGLAVLRFRISLLHLGFVRQGLAGLEADLDLNARTPASDRDRIDNTAIDEPRLTPVG